MSPVPEHLRARCAVLLFRSKGLVASLIRWQTRGEVSHAGFLLPDGRILEAWHTGTGVRIRESTAEEWARIEAYAVAGASDEHWETALGLAMNEVGKGYDFWAIVRFVSRERMPDNDRWFCSELVFAMLRAAGLPLLARLPASEVSPQALRTSPRLIPITP